MRILFIVPYTPTLIRVRPYQLIRTLGQQGHRVTLATLWTGDEERLALDEIGEYCEQVIMSHLPRGRVICNLLRSVFTPLPLQSAYCWQPELATRIATTLSEHTYDVVHLEHLRGARYGLAAMTTLTENRKSIPVIWDSVDCITHLFQQASEQSRSYKARLMTRLDLARTRRYEGWLVRQFDRVLVTSSTEKHALAALAQASLREGQVQRKSSLPALSTLTDFGRTRGPSGEVDSQLTVVANGVDLEYFAPKPGTQGEADVVFTGKMSYHANATASLYLVQEIMPRVWAQRPDATVWIVGKDPPAEVRALATSGGHMRRVVVTGTVPDIRPYLHRATLAVAPILYGAGIQNKLLEAMAAGAPVIASPLAAAGLPVQMSQSIVIADNADSFAAAILRLLKETSTRVLLGQRGRCYVEQHHAWPHVVTQLEGIYQRAIVEKQRQVHAVSF